MELQLEQQLEQQLEATLKCKLHTLKPTLFSSFKNLMKEVPLASQLLDGGVQHRKDEATEEHTKDEATEEDTKDKAMEEGSKDEAMAEDTKDEAMEEDTKDKAMEEDTFKKRMHMRRLKTPICHQRRLLSFVLNLQSRNSMKHTKNYMTSIGMVGAPSSCKLIPMSMVFGFRLTQDDTSIMYSCNL